MARNDRPSPPTLDTFRPTPKAYLLLAAEALKFAAAAPTLSAATRRKIATALASVQRDLENIGASGMKE
jgi:hypothetical protein